MSETRYFWLKLQDDFFNQKSIKKLRKMERGEFCTIVYLKMQLDSLRKGGVLTFDGVEESLEEEIALQIDEDVGDVQRTVDFLEKNKLLIRLSPEEGYLPEVVKNTGSEGASAKRMRDLRERERAGKPPDGIASQCDGGSSQCDGTASHSYTMSQCDASPSQCYGEKKREEKKREEGDEEKEKNKDSDTEESGRSTVSLPLEVQGASTAPLPPRADKEMDFAFEDRRRQAMNNVMSWNPSSSGED